MHAWMYVWMNVQCMHVYMNAMYERWTYACLYILIDMHAYMWCMNEWIHVYMHACDVHPMYECMRVYICMHVMYDCMHAYIHVWMMHACIYECTPCIYEPIVINKSRANHDCGYGVRIIGWSTEKIMGVSPSEYVFWLTGDVSKILPQGTFLNERTTSKVFKNLVPRPSLSL